MRNRAYILLVFLIASSCFSAFGQVTYTQSFDGGFPPANWTNTAGTGGYSWAQFTTGPHTGAGGAYFDAYDAASGDYAALITPKFDLSCRGAGVSAVSFWIYRSNTYVGVLDYVQVYVNTSASLVGATSLGTIYRDNSQAPAAVANTWNQYSFNIPAGAPWNGANNYVIFKAVSAYGDNIYFDDAQWVGYPCAGGAANDLCSGAIAVTCGNSYAGTTATATTGGDPIAYCGTTPGAAGVFYVLAGTGNNVTADVCTSSYDTKMNIYSGSCAALNCLNGNDDFCGFSSQVTFPTTIGVNYYIFINGYSATDIGTFTLHIACAAPAVGNDDCTNATALAVTANCAAPVAGNTTGATADIAGCSGNADDDVWYKFVATGTSHQITVVPIAAMDAVIELFSGTCSTLTSLYCKDVGAAGVTEVLNASGLTIGATYYVRVYHFGAGAGGAGGFTICLTLPPAAPANDNACGAILLTEAVGCVNTAGTTVNATQTFPGCSGTASADVWFKFVPTNTSCAITVAPNGTMDAVAQLYSGACGALTSIQCQDVNASAGSETINAIGLVVGNTYYVRVYDYTGATGTFNICVSGPAATIIPINDNPCGAIALPAITSACNYLEYTTANATPTTIAAFPGIPVPFGCIGGSGGAAGWTSVNTPDVWFSMICPSSGNITYLSEWGYGMTDPSAALYHYTGGPCTNPTLVQVYCSSDTVFPSGDCCKNYIRASGLIAGDTYYLRVWPWNPVTATQTFGFCVSSTSNDACAKALYICDLNGYSASTSPAFTRDYPDNMRGNNEVAVTHVTNGGVNSGGVFGKVDPAGDVQLPATEGVSLFDVQIDNNSWVRFTAASTKVVLNVTVSNCMKAKGLQMQIFSATNCTAFAPVSGFAESSNGAFTLTATNVTIGSDYLLMIDGFAGDICKYTISANSGVLFPDIVGNPTSVCIGGSSTLTAPAGATAWDWPTPGTPDSLQQVIIVSPATVTTYTCIVSGVCGFKQTLTTTVSVDNSCTILPIELLSFDADYNGKSVDLLWETATETNNNYFTIDRSTDGNDYTFLAKVPSKAAGGTSTSALSYTLNDPSVKSGHYYYRLKQTDLNGTYKYSAVATVTVDNLQDVFSLKPNPAENSVEILYRCNSDESALLKVFDFKGQQIVATEVQCSAGNNTSKLDLSLLPDGMYFVSLGANGKLYKTKLVIQKH
jgi:hypothetical protein